MDEVTKAAVKNAFLEELKDVEKYIEMSKKVSDENCMKQIFRDMAKDEMSHAEHLKMIIHENDFKVTEEEHKKVQEMYKKIKEEYEKM